MDRGYFIFHRKYWSKYMQRNLIWFHLHMMANHQKTEYREPGTVVVNIEELVRRSKLEKNEIRRILNILLKDGLITIQRFDDDYVIRILTWMDKRIRGGWIKIWRKIEDNQELTDQRKLVIWLTCLMKANYHRDDDREKSTSQLLPGQFITGRLSFQKETLIDDNFIDRAFKHFEEKGMISQTYHKKGGKICGRLVSILSWDKFQAIYSPVNLTLNDNNRNVNLTLNEKSHCVKPSLNENPQENMFFQMKKTKKSSSAEHLTKKAHGSSGQLLGSSNISSGQLLGTSQECKKCIGKKNEKRSEIISPENHEMIGKKEEKQVEFVAKTFIEYEKPQEDPKVIAMFKATSDPDDPPLETINKNQKISKIASRKEVDWNAIDKPRREIEQYYFEKSRANLEAAKFHVDAETRLLTKKIYDSYPEFDSYGKKVIKKDEDQQIICKYLMNGIQLYSFKGRYKTRFLKTHKEIYDHYRNKFSIVRGNNMMSGCPIPSLHDFLLDMLPRERITLQETYEDLYRREFAEGRGSYYHIRDEEEYVQKRLSGAIT